MLIRLVFLPGALRALLLVVLFATPAVAEVCDPYGGACGELYHFTQLETIYRTRCTTDHGEGIIDSDPAHGTLHMQSWQTVGFDAGWAATLRLEGAPPGTAIEKIRIRFAGTNRLPYVSTMLSVFDEHGHPRLERPLESSGNAWSDSVDVDMVQAANGEVTFFVLLELEGDDDLDATLSYSVVDVSPGARVVGCYGYLQEGPPLPTPTRPLSWGRVKAAYR